MFVCLSALCTIDCIDPIIIGYIFLHIYIFSFNKKEMHIINSNIVYLFSILKPKMVLVIKYYTFFSLSTFENVILIYIYLYYI